MGESVQSLLTLLHASTPCALPAINGTAYSTYFPHLIEDILCPLYPVQSLTANSYYGPWHYINDCFTFARGSVEVGLFHGSAAYVYGATTSTFVGGMKPNTVLATIRPFNAAVYVGTPSQPISRTITSTTNDATIDTPTMAEVASGFMTTNPRLTNLTSVRLPYYLPLPWIFRAPNCLANSAVVTGITAQDSVHFRITTIPDPSLGYTNQMYTWTAPSRFVTYTAADDYRMAHLRPHIGLTYSSSALTSIRARRRQLYLTPLV